MIYLSTEIEDNSRMSFYLLTMSEDNASNAAYKVTEESGQKPIPRHQSSATLV